MFVATRPGGGLATANALIVHNMTDEIRVSVRTARERGGGRMWGYCSDWLSSTLHRTSNWRAKVHNNEYP